MSKITSKEGRAKRINKIAQNEPMPSVVKILATAPDINLPQIKVTKTIKSEDREYQDNIKEIISFSLTDNLVQYI